MKFIKRWTYLWILAAFGTVFFAATDSWDEIKRPYEQAVEWYRNEVAWEAWSEGDGKEDAGKEKPQISGGDSGMESDGQTLSQPDAGVISGGDQTGEAGGGNGQETEVGETPPEEVTSRRPEEVQYTAVEDDYFSDAVFIGDSRTVGMFEYGGLENISTFYASTGLTVYKIFDSPIVTVPDGKEKITVAQALSQQQFKKIYLMIGINEMGRGTVESFTQKYKEVVDQLKILQPDAVIYLQGIMKVTTQRSDKGDYINNAGIDERNAEIARLADYVRVYYLDVNPLICDNTGGMNPDYTFDGVHLKAQYIPIWKDFLKQYGLTEANADNDIE